MVPAIIPHFVSVPRFRGRPCLLTRMELLPVGRELISSLSRGPNPTRSLPGARSLAERGLSPRVIAS